MGNRSHNIFVAIGSAAEIERLRTQFMVEEAPAVAAGGLQQLHFDQLGLDDGPTYLLGDRISKEFPGLALSCQYHPEGSNWALQGVAEWHAGKRWREIMVPT